MNDDTRPLLTLTEAEMRSVLAQVSEIIVQNYVNLRNLRATSPSDIGALRAGLSVDLPIDPMPPQDVIKVFQNFVVKEMFHSDHPRNFAFVPSPSNFMGAMGDALAAAFNVFCGSWIGPSGSAQVELITIDWLRQLLYLPETAAGLFVSGGSAANLTGLAVARHVKLGGDPHEGVIYFSDQTHSCVPKGLKVLGFQPHQMRKLETDQNFRLPMDTLRQQVASDRAKGLKPFCVIANAGTTNTGAVDPMHAVADFCAAENLWMHVDGAYGGSAAISAKGKQALDGMERADSLAIDPHKWLFQPYEIGCAMVRDKSLLHRTFSTSAEYLKIVEHGAEQPNFSDYGVQLSRNFRALKLWMSFKTYGIAEFRRAIETGIDHAAHVETLLRADADTWDIVTPRSLSVITFRFRAPGLDIAAQDKLTNDIAQGLIDTGFALMSPTTLRGRQVLRMCITNPRATRQDIEDTIARLKAIGQSLLADAKRG